MVIYGDVSSRGVAHDDWYQWPENPGNSSRVNRVQECSNWWLCSLCSLIPGGQHEHTMFFPQTKWHEVTWSDQKLNLITKSVAFLGLLSSGLWCIDRLLSLADPCHHIKVQYFFGKSWEEVPAHDLDQRIPRWSVGRTWTIPSSVWSQDMIQWYLKPINHKASKRRPINNDPLVNFQFNWSEVGGFRRCSGSVAHGMLQFRALSCRMYSCFWATWVWFKIVCPQNTDSPTILSRL